MSVMHLPSLENDHNDLPWEPHGFRVARLSQRMNHSLKKTKNAESFETLINVTGDSARSSGGKDAASNARTSNVARDSKDINALAKWSIDASYGGLGATEGDFDADEDVILRIGEATNRSQRNTRFADDGSIARVTLPSVFRQSFGTENSDSSLLIDAQKKSMNVSRAKTGNSRRKRLIKSQEMSSERLARSKWRRDPIKERLLFLTGNGQAHIENPDYVNHLDLILQQKHKESELDRIAKLTMLERDREWLFRVKYDLDFEEMELESLEKRRQERAIAEAAARDKGGALFANKEMEYYTIAQRTPGLDAQRNVDKVVASFAKDHIDNYQKRIANRRYTRLRSLMENYDEELSDFLNAKTVQDLYLGSEPFVEDCMTVDEQELYGDV